MIPDTIVLPDAPPIPGLVFRHIRMPEDFHHMAAITRACAVVDGTERADTAEELASFFAHLTNCDPSTDMIFAQVDHGDGREPETISYSRGTWREEASGERRYMFFGRIIPAWRRKGIGRAMLSWMEKRLREIAAGHPAEVKKYILCVAEQGEAGFAAMVEKAGYEPARYGFHMVRPDLENIPDFSLPEGLEVRPVLPEHYRAIWEADNEGFRDHWGFVEGDEEDYQAWLTDTITFQPELWQVAWDSATDQVAGQVRTYINHDQNKLYNRKRGYTEFISVRRAWRRRGLARALIARSLRAQKKAGMSESALQVDSENLSGAVRIYEDCGFRVVKRETIYRKPLS
jgi:ribosomal protein S18 acetylase RimI-like enzyme